MSESRRTGERVACVALRHEYSVDEESVIAIDGIDLVIPAGTAAAIIGPSGSGKSTLLTLLAGLQRPTSGSIQIGDTDLTLATEREMLLIRATRLAVVAQNPYRNLLPYATAFENLLFAQRAPRSHRKHDLPAVGSLLAELGLAHVAHTTCDRLSGGERQRLALAAALATRPSVLIVDEPSSQLDRANRDVVAGILAEASTGRGVTVVAVTHDHVLAERLGRVITIAEGRINE